MKRNMTRSLVEILKDLGAQRLDSLISGSDPVPVYDKNCLGPDHVGRGCNGALVPFGRNHDRLFSLALNDEIKVNNDNKR